MSHEGSNENASPKSESKLPRVPIGELIGFRMLDADNGHAVATMQTGPHHANPMGSLHGGVLCDISDAAMGYAFAYPYRLPLNMTNGGGGVSGFG